MGRVTRLINREWTFAYGQNPGAEQPDFDDSGWYEIGLPHSFGIPYFMETDFYTGVGMYRHRFNLDPDDLGRRIAIEFQGVFQDATVFINGTAVGRHRGGYTAFAMDASAYVRAGQNLLAVRVSNEWDARLAPRAGEHVFNGGIYRDVALSISSNVRLAWYGTYVQTLSVSGEIAVLAIETELVNDTAKTSSVDLVSSVIDPLGVPIATVRRPVVIDASSTVLQHDSIDIRSVSLWSPDSPALYRLEQALVVDGEIIDNASVEFGIRTIEFTADRGFFLNGNHLWITGANVHQDHAGWSDAVTRRGMARDVRLIKEAGMNLIRGSHYPHHDHFAAECDRQGMMFWSELAFWGIGGSNAEGFWNASAYPPNAGDQREFDESCFDQLREMIRVNRNHPSIVTWSTGNEVFFSDDIVIPAAKDLTVRLANLARELDPGRPVAVGGAQRRDFDVLADIAGYNGDGAALFQDPGFPNIVSEYGSVVEDRPGTFAGRYSDGTEAQHSWRSGVVLWCGFHHGSIVPEMGRMGFIDYFRIPLRSWHWYRKELRGIEPPDWRSGDQPEALKVSADRYTIETDGTDDTMLTIQLVDANGRTVTDHSGRSVLLEVVEGGGVFPTGTSITLSAENGGFRAGQGAIEFRSYFSGVNHIRVRSHGLPETEIFVCAQHGPAWDGRARRLQSGPPSTAGLRVRGNRRVLSEKRPAFSSSFETNHDPGLVTDPTTLRGWLPHEGETDPWLRVELEGLWMIDRVLITFGPGGAVPYILSTIEAPGSIHEVERGKASDMTIDHVFPERHARAVRIQFPEGRREIVELRVEGW